jgi:uncharacterized protein YrrD
MTRLELRFGAPVTHDGKRLGSLSGVILDGAGRRWDALVVRRGLLRRSHWLVPRSDVCDASDERVVLDAPPTIPADASASRGLSAGTRVGAQDGRALGRLALLLTRADGRLLDLVIERRSFGPRRMIPAESLVAVQARELVVALPQAVEALSPYRADPQLAVLARWAIERLGIPGRFEGLHTRVSATDGVITLEGHATSRLRAAQMAAAVAAVPGVRGVENRLVCDDELTIAVARALDEDARTRGHLIRVAAHRGAITLGGRAPVAETADVAERIAASVPGVLVVVNQLRTAGFRVDRGSVETAAGRKPAPAGDGARAATERPASGRRQPPRAA